MKVYYPYHLFNTDESITNTAIINKTNGPNAMIIEEVLRQRYEGIKNERSGTEGS